MIRGAHFGEEQRAKVAILGARTTAVLMRYPRNRRLPGLEQLWRTKPRRMQTKNEQRAFLLEWARRGQRQGLAIRIGRLDQPFGGPEVTGNA